MANPPPLAGDRARRTALQDELVVIGCQLGERAAFDALIARWHDPLWRYARRLTDSDDAAAETTQEVWLRVCRGIARLRDAARFRAWMFGIARRVVMDRLREQYAAPPMADVDDADLPSAADPELAERIAHLHEELSRLPPAEREALVLFYLEDLTLAELAEVWTVPVGTVKSRLFRARRALGELLVGKGFSS
jgi:RNA polymerase sigma-70 factor (ECF subfamily)